MTPKAKRKYIMDALREGRIIYAAGGSKQKVEAMLRGADSQSFWLSRERLRDGVLDEELRNASYPSCEFLITNGIVTLLDKSGASMMDVAEGELLVTGYCPGNHPFDEKIGHQPVWAFLCLQDGSFDFFVIGNKELMK